MKIKHILALCVVLVLLGCKGGFTQADIDSAKQSAIKGYQKCALAFSEGYQDVDTSGDYHKAYGQAVELINKRTACENAVIKTL